MDTSALVKERLGVPIIIGLGGALSLVHVWHAVGEEEDLLTFALGIGGPLLLTGGVLVGGVWLWNRDTDGRHALRIGAWSWLGAALVAGGAALLILYQQQYGVTMDEQLFVVIDGASGGAFTGFIVGVYDVRQRQAEARATELTRQLTILNRVLRHDIRTNANIIQGNANLLTSDAVDTDEKADAIKRQATDLVELGEQARDIERVLIDGESDRDERDLSSLVETCCEQVRQDHPSAEVDVSLPPTLTVAAHPLLDSAVANVVENAVEHKDKPTPRVEIESAVVSRDGTDFVDLRIADNGPGIDEAEVEVLKRGYETDLEHTSGLGLWLVSWIVARSGGEVRFDENDPEGSVVTLRLRRGTDRVAPASESNAAGAAA